MRLLSTFSRLRTCACLVVLTAPFALTGCIHDGVHRPVQAAQFVPDTMTPQVDWWSSDLKYSIPERNHPKGDTDHATVEFLEDGALADKCTAGPLPAGKLPCQRDFAEAFILQARRQAEAEGKRLVVITFIHGNENYAGENADNYPHFRQLIACLNLGYDEYKANKTYATYYEGKDKHGDDKMRRATNSCEYFKPTPGVRFIGVFIGWRGLTTLLHANIRERAAMKISRHPEFVDTLYALRDAAKQASDAVRGKAFEGPARFLIFGHSFGGLLLEQSAFHIYADAFAYPENTVGPCPDSPNGDTGLKPFTDMIVTVNAAVHAVQAKKIVEMFQMHPDAFCGSNSVASSLSRPLLVSLVSKSDFWSEPTGSTLRHVLGGEREYTDGFHLTDGVYQYEPGFHLVYTKTPGWLTYFQNICYLDSENANEGNTVCQLEQHPVFGVEEAQAIESDHKQSTGAQSTTLVKDDNPINHLYVRFDCKPADKPNPNDHRKACLTPEPYANRSDLHVWNRTPYWISAIDIDIINGHNDLWNAKFIALLSGLTAAFPPLTADEVLPKPQRLPEF